MRKYGFVGLMALVATPVLASHDMAAATRSAGNPVDMLYPEIAVDDDGWRGLLPVILIDIDAVVDQPEKGSEPGKRSERSDRH